MKLTRWQELILDELDYVPEDIETIVALGVGKFGNVSAQKIVVIAYRDGDD